MLTLQQKLNKRFANRSKAAKRWRKLEGFWIAPREQNPTVEKSKKAIRKKLV